MKSSICLTVAVALAATAFAACAPPRAASTSTTGAEVSGPSDPERATAKLAAAPAFDVAGEPEEAPGQLVCRTKSPTDGTAELFLTWNGGMAKGTLRRVAPSGMIYVQKVQAERAGTLIVADATCGETDLVTHTAMIVQQNGKQHMRLGDGNRPWSACE